MNEDESNLPYKVYYKHYRIPDYMECLMTEAQMRTKPKKNHLKHYRRGDFNRFLPSPFGGKTEAFIMCGDIVYHGECICSMSDNFCYAVGRDIALRRAVKEMMGNKDVVASVA